LRRKKKRNLGTVEEFVIAVWVGEVLPEVI